MLLRFVRSFCRCRELIFVATAAVVWFSAPWVNAQYTGSDLYLLPEPTGYTASSTVDFSNGSQSTEGGQAVGSWMKTATSNTDALLWTGASSYVDLSPATFTYSTANATDGIQQAGYGIYPGSDGNPNALLWSGTAASAVNLNPTGYASSGINGLVPGQQVGFGFPTALSNYNAVMWSNTAASYVNLNPTIFTASVAYGTDGSQQVGDGVTSTDPDNAHAALWSSTAASAVDLEPTTVTVPGITESYAFGVGGNQQVGEAYGSFASSGTNHALLWTGTAASAVDLNPTGFVDSVAYATNGSDQVGYGDVNGKGTDLQALLWTGSAGSFINLQSLLPSNITWVSSAAYSINAAGDIFGLAFSLVSGVDRGYAVEWTPPGLTWAAPVSGNWSDETSWIPDTATPTSGTGVSFVTGSATPYTATLTTSSSAASIIVQDNVTIQKAGNSLTVPGAVSIAGTQAQQASLALAGAGTSTFGSLSINSYGQLDITDNKVVINYGVGNPSPVSSIGAYINSGYNGDTWNGVGIVSSKVASVNASLGDPHAYGIGYADASDPAVAVDDFTPGTVVIEPAIVGDANLDGKVNFSDFQLLAASFNGNNTSWDQGNFNYDAKTNFSDFQLLAANFNNSTTLDNAQFDAMDQFAMSNGFSMTANADGDGFTLTAVPEPAAVSMLAIAGLGLLGRRRGAGTIHIRRTAMAVSPSR